jgi:hypothetical protein
MSLQMSCTPFSASTVCRSPCLFLFKTPLNILLVVINDRKSAQLEDLQSVADRLYLVVVALDEGLSSYVILI